MITNNHHEFQRTNLSEKVVRNSINTPEFLLNFFSNLLRLSNYFINQSIRLMDGNTPSIQHVNHDSTHPFHSLRVQSFP